MGASFARDIEDYGAARCGAIELYFGKLEAFLESHEPQDVLRLLEQHELTAPVASFQGGLLDRQADARREAWDLFRQRLAICQTLGVHTLVVAGDIRQPPDQTVLDRVRASLRLAAEEAGRFGVRLALEFQADARLANNLQTALSLVHETDSRNLGICFDVFHYYTGPSKFEDLALLTPECLFHVQLCDLAGTPRELATAADVVLPGDGDFQLTPLIEQFRRIGYEGYVSLEIMNPQLWSIPPLQLGEIGVTALRRLLGLAGMQ